MKKKVYQKGQTINGLEFVKELPERVHPSGKKKRIALMRCKCSRVFKTYLYSVIDGTFTRCPECSKKIVGEKNSTHRMISHRLYGVWSEMKKRCYSKDYKYYNFWGGRGIKICNEWRGDFMAFYNYAINLPNSMTPGYSIDRIDNDGHYEPGNIRFANGSIQNYNKGVQKNNKTGYKGISERKYGTYQAQVRHGGVCNYLGTFKTINEAIEARNRFLVDVGIFDLYTKYESKP